MSESVVVSAVALKAYLLQKIQLETPVLVHAIIEGE